MNDKTVEMYNVATTKNHNNKEKIMNRITSAFTKNCEL